MVFVIAANSAMVQDVQLYSFLAAFAWLSALGGYTFTTVSNETLTWPRGPMMPSTH